MDTRLIISVLVIAQVANNEGLSDAYTIDPEMKCAVEGNQLSYVIRINVTEENKAKIHAADPDVSSKAYIMTDGKRCEDSTAEVVTESGVEKLKIHAPLLKCGSVEKQSNGDYKYEATVRITTDRVIATSNHIYTLTCLLQSVAKESLPGGIVIGIGNEEKAENAKAELLKRDRKEELKVRSGAKNPLLVSSILSLIRNADEADIELMEEMLKGKSDTGLKKEATMRRAKDDKFQRLEKKIQKNSALISSLEKNLTTKISSIERNLTTRISSLEERGCVSGVNWTSIGYDKPDGFHERKRISFGRTFARPPAFIAALAGIYRKQQGTGDQEWGVYVWYRPRVSTSGAEILLQGLYTEIRSLEIHWMACSAGSA